MVGSDIAVRRTSYEYPVPIDLLASLSLGWSHAPCSAVLSALVMTSAPTATQGRPGSWKAALAQV